MRRLQADFENYRKRVERQFEELAARGVAALVGRLLPVLDALDLAEAHLLARGVADPALAEETRALVQARALLLDTLEKEGLERAGAAGEPSTRRCTTPSRTPRRGRAARRGGAPSGLPLARPGAAPGHGESQGLMAERAWLETDYYKALGVPSSATDKEITRAYRKLAKAHHPDTNPGSEERFKEISAAYDVLGDAPKRKEYDEVRAASGRSVAPSAGRAASARRAAPRSRWATSGTSATCSAGSSARARRAPKRGADVETALHLGFEDAVRGVTTSVHLPTDAPCRTCKGSGAAPGTSPVECERCHGRGVLDDDKGMFSLSRSVPPARAAARGSRRRARRATARAARHRVVRSRSASPRASRAASASA